MQAERLANGTERPTAWIAVDWPRANRMVRNLRWRIFRATQAGDWNKVRSLQQLMLRSSSNRLVSVRRVTQTNAGKETPGVDKVVVKTPEERGRLVDGLATVAAVEGKANQTGVHSQSQRQTQTARYSRGERSLPSSHGQKCARTVLGSQI